MIQICAGASRRIATHITASRDCSGQIKNAGTSRAELDDLQGMLAYCWRTQVQRRVLLVALICGVLSPLSPFERRPRRIRENLGACGWRLSAAEVRALDDAAAAATKKATQNIFMTS